MARNKSKALWPILIGAVPFVLIGLAALLLAGWQIVSHLRALGWEEQPATLLSLQASASSGSSGSSIRRSQVSRLEGSYRYTIAGREYVGERISFSLIRADGIDDWDDGIRETLGQPGNNITVLVNPADPAESVAIPDIRWAEVGAALFFTFGMGGGGLALLAMALAGDRHPVQADKKVPPVRGSTVIAMCLLGPVFATLSWLLWRDDHGIWAGLAALQLGLTVNAAVVYVRQRSRAG